MRNLKKLLALTLALAMAFSLMLGASAADVKFEDYPDKDSITAEFTEGVQVLTGLKVFQGDEKGFRPSDKITRAEASAIIYRMATGDVDNRQNDLYKDYSTFVDVNSDDWFAGYVGYCQNAGYIKGTTPTTFNPYGQVTGYEVLAMILRVVGYGKNNEFTGSSWQVNVAALSRELGVTKNVTAAHMEQTLNMAAPREVVADLVFMTAAIVPTVTYTPALAYNDKSTVLGGEYNATLGQKTFGLWYQTAWTESDEWGRPGYSWYKNGARVDRTNAETGKAYMIKDGHPLYRGNTTGNLVATIMAAPDYETKEQVRECDVAHDLEITNAQTFDLYVNSENVTAEDYKIVATDTVTKVGGQGRVTEFYYGITSPWFVDNEDDYAVMIDTMLAQITGKRDVKLDKNDHVIVPAQLDVVIYDGDKKTPNTPNSSTRIISKPGNSKDNWEYAVGDFILINAYTDQSTHNVHNGSSADLEKAAFETNKVIARYKSTHSINTLYQGESVWVIKTPDVKQAKQTVTYWNQGKHNVDGTDIPDQMTLFLDVAGSTTNTTYNWYFDLYGNIIGIGPAKGSNFGVITAVYAAQAQGETDTTGTTKAIATVRYADGTTGTVQIDRFLMSTNQANDDGATNTNMNSSQHATAGTALTAGSNTADIRPRYNPGNSNPMQVYAPWVPFAANGAESDAWVFMSPDTSVNADAHFGKNYDTHGILWDNLFMFTTASDDAVVAVEVAGQTFTHPATNPNSGFWTNLRNAANTDGVGGMIYKNASFVTLNSGNANAGEAGVGNVGQADIYIDNDTQIMVRTGNTSIATYDGVNALPGNVKINAGAEVDWADTDNDGRADYLYVRGNANGVITYGLFYYNAYNGDVARWDGTAGNGTISGYLNGEAYTATFHNRTLFDQVNNSANYNGHLFALQFTGDAVTGVLANPTNGVQFLNNATTNNQSSETVTSFNTNLVVGATGFGLGSAYDNNYTATTEAVYYRDTNVVAGGNDNLTYRYDNHTSGGRTVTVSGAHSVTYWLTPNCTVVGELEWLNQRTGNEVTMVYEHNATGTQPYAVTAIYITPDPDVTPDGTLNNQLLLESMRVVHNTATNAMDLEIRVYAQNLNGFVPTTPMGATVTLKNENTNSLILNGAAVLGSAIIADSNYAAGSGHYIITVTGAGATLNNAAGQTYSSTVTLSLNDASSVNRIFTGNFTNHGIL